MKVEYNIHDHKFIGLAFHSNKAGITSATKITKSGFLWNKKVLEEIVYLVRVVRSEVTSCGPCIDVDYYWRTIAEFKTSQEAKDFLEEYNNLNNSRGTNE